MDERISTERVVSDDAMQIWKHGADTSNYEKALTLFRWLLCLLAATIPLEGSLLPLFRYFEISTYRTPSFLLGSFCAILSVFFFPRIIKQLARAPFIYFMLIACTLALLVRLMSGEFVVFLASYRKIDSGVDQLFKQIYMAMMFLVLIENETWRKRLIRFFFIGWVLFILLSLYYIMSKQALLVYSEGTVRSRELLLWDANLHSVLSVVGTILCFDWLLGETRKWRSWGLFLIWALGLLSCFFGSSRIGTIILFLGLALVPMLRFRYPGQTQTNVRRLKEIMVVLFLFGVGVIILANIDIAQPFVSSVEKRFSLTFRYRDFGERDKLAGQTLDIISEYPFGVGMGNASLLLRGSDPHNDYLRLVAEAGWLGGLFLFLGLISLLKNCVAWLKRGDPKGSITVLILLLMANMTLQGFHRQFFWLFLTLYSLAPPPKREEDGEFPGLW